LQDGKREKRRGMDIVVRKALIININQGMTYFGCIPC
jgi:hypothetical protein